MPTTVEKIPESTHSAGSKIKPTKPVYPLVYTRQLQDFDNWDHMFHVHILNRISAHDFIEPPKSVLELGCGSGIWVIDAAKRWKQTTFVGFDLEKLQPDLFRCGLTDLATRIEWVHGDFLDPLPFLSEYFDFVRIHCVGLGVPENKWQDLLEEVRRVLKLGGQLEITEEDQIFPFGHNPQDNDSASSLLIPTENSDNPKLLITTSDLSSDSISPVSPGSLLLDRSSSWGSDQSSSREGGILNSPTATGNEDAHSNIFSAGRPTNASSLTFLRSSSLDLPRTSPKVERISVGRGGSGNIRSRSRSRARVRVSTIPSSPVASKPKSISAPSKIYTSQPISSSKSKVISTGRGGSGNIRARSKFKPPLENALLRPRPTPSVISTIRPNSPRGFTYKINPRDHRRLSVSWKSMLNRRFIATVPLPVLSFYLSATFDRVMPLPQLLVRLPQNSGLVKSETQDRIYHSSNGGTFDVHPNRPAAPATWNSDQARLNIPLPCSSNAVHLARRFYTIAACKEAMWAEYEILYGNVPTSPKVGSFDESEGSHNTLREDFEFHWSNWVDDMTDRIGMRSVVASALSWPIPPTSDTPSSVTWRDRCGLINEMDGGDDTAFSETDICRSLRCFLAWKTQS